MPVRKGDGPRQDYIGLRRAAVPPRRLYRVLLVDQSRVDRLLVSATLVLKGCVEMKLTEAIDLDLGLSLLLQRQYDLILLDDAWPGHSPWEVSRAIRGVAPTTPIIQHRQYLEGSLEAFDGLNKLVEAIEGVLTSVHVTPSFASELWISASAVS